MQFHACHMFRVKLVDKLNPKLHSKRQDLLNDSRKSHIVCGYRSQDSNLKTSQ